MRIPLASNIDKKDDKKDDKFQELLIQEFRNCSEEIRHIESIIFQCLGLFLTIFLAYAAFLAKAISDNVKYCSENSENLYTCKEEQYKIAGLFYFSKELIGITVFAGFVVFFICNCIILIMTKASQTKFINKRNRNNIRDTIYQNTKTKEYLDVCLQVKKRQDDIISKIILSIRRISKIILLFYIISLWAFTFYVVIQQLFIQRSNTSSNYKEYILYEFIVLGIELLLICLYIYFYTFVWRNPISKRIKRSLILWKKYTFKGKTTDWKKFFGFGYEKIGK
jgi:hypothetical protein